MQCRPGASSRGEREACFFPRLRGRVGWGHLPASTESVVSAVPRPSPAARSARRPLPAKERGEVRAPVNPSLILFVKMAARAVAVSRGGMADVVISAVFPASVA